MSGILARGIVYVVGALGAFVFFWASLINFAFFLFGTAQFYWALPVLMVAFFVLAVVGFVISAKRIVQESDRAFNTPPSWDF